MRVCSQSRRKTWQPLVQSAPCSPPHVVQQLAIGLTMLSPYDSINITDHSGVLLQPELSPLVGKCRSAIARRAARSSKMPPLRVDPLSPLPLADAAKPSPAVRFVYFIMASRSYAHETINRNVRALQRPGALSDAGTNESNLFLLHVDAKMTAADRATLHANVRQGPDVYYLREPRHVMWAGFSMVLALLDAMASLVGRRLHFEMLINLSDADLTLRTDGEIRDFFARYPGRSIMSIVPRKRDPRRYKLHENFRKFCWIECDEGSGWVVSTPSGESLDAQRVIGKQKCCWSRSAPIVYTRHPISCANAQLPEVFHGSQWASLHRSLVLQMLEHPTAQVSVAWSVGIGWHRLSSAGFGCGRLLWMSARAHRAQPLCLCACDGVSGCLCACDGVQRLSAYAARLLTVRLAPLVLRASRRRWSTRCCPTRHCCRRRPSTRHSGGR